MITKSKIQLISSLKNKKYRYNNLLFVAEGEKWIKEIINEGAKVDSIYTSDEQFFNEITANKNYHNNTFLIKQKLIEKISALKTPTKTIAVLPFLSYKKNKTENIVLACESIRDPGNLGTIIRIADWFAIDKLILSNDCVDFYNNKVVQATMGSLLRVNIETTNLEAYFNKTTLPVFATTLKGKALNNVKKPKSGIFLIGNESNGISNNLVKQANHQIKIEKYGKAESLNAAIACAIICNWVKA